MSLRGAGLPYRSGVAAYHSLPPRYVGVPAGENYIKRLIRCPEAARPNWTVQGAPLRDLVREMAALSVTEKAPEQSGKPTRVLVCESSLLSSYGDPVLEWRRPGGSVSAVMRQG